MKIDWDDIKQSISTIAVAIVFVVLMYFGIKRMVYCFQKTGWLDCTVVVDGK